MGGTPCSSDLENDGKEEEAEEEDNETTMAPAGSMG